MILNLPEIKTIYCIKKMEIGDVDFITSMKVLIDLETKYEDYLKNKFNLRFIVLEVSLDKADKRKIFLFKKIKGFHYSAKKRYFVFSPFEKVERIKIINNKQQIILDEFFEIACYVDKENSEESFFFIRDRKLFEDLFDYHKKYSKAYDKISNTLDFVDWTKAESTVPVQRSCYTLSKFDKLDECIEKIKSDLMSDSDNLTKKTFESKKIAYVIESGQVKINPEGALKLRAFLKIIQDGIVRTYLLGREGITGDFEELGNQ